MLKIQDPDLEKLLNFLARQEEFVFLDTSRPDHENVESLLFLKPVDRLLCRIGDSLTDYLALLQERLAQGFYLAGWIGYEFGAMLEADLKAKCGQDPENQMVLADLGVFLEPYRFDHHTGENNFPFATELRAPESGYTISNLRPNMTKEMFLEALDRVREYIVAGDTYQVNYTLKLLFDFEGSVEKFYMNLRRNQSVPYGAYIRNGAERTLSFSPELFFRKKGDEITVRPMKGTSIKGRNVFEEKHNSSTLHHDDKNRSENVMIVDLLRNDLARLMHGLGESRVFVDSLFDVESYESLLQMTSTIKARSAPLPMDKLSLSALFRALFPCGSITGAPKIRTMQIIDELEKEQRGVYTGAIGYFGPDGSAIFNVPIRTVQLRGEKGEMGIGAGITHDSVAEEEWRESLLKGRFLTHSQPDFQLLETMLWQPPTGYLFLEEHLKRLENGAEFFKFSCDLQAVRVRLLEEQKDFTDGCYRLRLVLAKDGRISTSTMPCPQPLMTELPQKPQQDEQADLQLIDFSGQCLDDSGPWLFHKTTMRTWYDEGYGRARQDGLFDLIFCNAAGEVTEGCITNIVIYSGGRYLTPPAASGLLPGLMRQHLLNRGVVPVVEKSLTRGEVQSAEAIYLCNSVRGLVRVKLRE